MTEFGRLVAERMGWTVPSLDSASSILDFMRESAAFQRKVEDWAKANPGEAAELRQHAAEEATRKHEDRISDRKSTRLNSSHVKISYAVFCLKKKKKQKRH